MTDPLFEKIASTLSRESSGGPSKMQRRRAARLAAIQALYQLIHLGLELEPVKELMRTYYFGYEHEGALFVKPASELFDKIVDGVYGDMIGMTAIIDEGFDEDKDFQSCDLVHRLICMAGAFELQRHLEIDGAIIINDYVNLTHAFYEGGESRSVNALLDSISKRFRLH